MSKTLLTLLIIGSWFLISTTTLVFSLDMYSRAKKTKEIGVLINSISKDIAYSPYKLYSAAPPATLDLINAIKTEDARPVLVERFLRENSSPMQGLGDKFVKIADKYQLDWRLLPAIAFQESNLGKKVPKNSFNPFGWAVYTGKNSGANFSSWENGIETVASGLKQNYIDQGLNTPAKIMLKYTDSVGTWAPAVETAMAMIEQ